MSIEEFIPASTDEERMLYAAERVGGLLALYGESFSIENGREVPTGDSATADILRGSLQSHESDSSVLDVTYHVTEPDAFPGRLLSFTKMTAYSPPADIQRPGHRAASRSLFRRLFGRHSTDQHRLDYLAAIRDGLFPSKPEEPIEPYLAKYDIDAGGNITAVRLPEASPLPLSKEEKRLINLVLSLAQPRINY